MATGDDDARISTGREKVLSAFRFSHRPQANNDTQQHVNANAGQDDGVSIHRSAFVFLPGSAANGIGISTPQTVGRRRRNKPK